MEITITCEKCEETQNFNNIPLNSTSVSLHIAKAGWEIKESEIFTCPKCIKEKENNVIPEKLICDVYIHGDKESMHGLLDELEDEHDFTFPDKLRRDFIYIGMEVVFTVELDTKNSTYKVIKVSGVDVSNLDIKI